MHVHRVGFDLFLRLQIQLHLLADHCIYEATTTTATKQELAWLDRGYTTQSTENKNMNVTRKIITETETLKSVIDQQSIKN
jgi:hypothetical protein